MKKLGPYLDVIVAGIIWGLNGSAVKFLHLPSLTLSGIRCGMPTILILLYFIFRGKKLFTFNYRLLGASILNMFRMLLYFMGFLRTTIGNAVIILYTWPIFTSLCSIIFLKEKISLKKAGFIALAFMGVLFTFIDKNISFSDTHFVGMSAVLLSAFLTGFMNVLLKKELESKPRLMVIFYQNLIGAIFFIPFIFILRPFPTALQLGVGVSWGTLTGVIAFMLFFSGLRSLKASTASSLAYIEVVSAIIFGMIFFKESLTWNMVLGAAMIILSSYLIRKHD